MKIDFTKLVNDITIQIYDLDGDSLAELYNTLCGTNLIFDEEQEVWTDGQREAS
jgi:hypothetical protein